MIMLIFTYNRPSVVVRLLPFFDSAGFAGDLRTWRIFDTGGRCDELSEIFIRVSRR